MLQFHLLQLTVSGIKNITEPLNFNFYKETINNNFNPNEYRIKSIYGENGSGKTAVITAVKILHNLIVNKYYLFDTSVQETLSETINKKTRAGFIECEFKLYDFDHSLEKLNYILKYRVDFKLDENNYTMITSEKFEKKKGNYSKNQYSIVFETQNGTLIRSNENSLLCNVFLDITKNLLDKRTLVTWAMEQLSDLDMEAKINLAPLVLLYLFGCFLNAYIDHEDNHTDFILSQRLKQFDATVTADKQVEMMINETKEKLITIKEDEWRVSKSEINTLREQVDRKFNFIKIFKSDLQMIRIETKDMGNEYSYRLILVYPDYEVDSEFESRGIRKLLKLFDYLDMACNGMIVFIDELDANISDIYLGKIIEYFLKYGKGQLCFTAHNLSPMTTLTENGCKNSIDFISSINTVHSWKRNGNLNPINAYRNGFIDDSPFNVDSSDFLGVLGGINE